MSSCIYPFFLPRGNEPPPTLRGRLNPHLYLQRRRLQSPTMSNARTLICTQWVHSFSFPPHPLRTTSSRFSNMIRFGSRPPLIRMSALTRLSLLVRNVVSMLSHRDISTARLYEVIRWGLVSLRCAPIMRSKTRWCTIQSLDSVLAKGPRTTSSIQ